MCLACVLAYRALCCVPADWAAARLVPCKPQIFDVRDMGALPGAADVAPYARMTAPLAVNNLSALLPTLGATRWGCVAELRVAVTCRHCDGVVECLCLHRRADKCHSALCSSC